MDGLSCNYCGHENTQHYVTTSACMGKASCSQCTSERGSDREAQGSGSGTDAAGPSPPDGPERPHSSNAPSEAEKAWWEWRDSLATELPPTFEADIGTAFLAGYSAAAARSRELLDECAKVLKPARGVVHVELCPNIRFDGDYAGEPEQHNDLCWRIVALLTRIEAAKGEK